MEQWCFERTISKINKIEEALRNKTLPLTKIVTSMRISPHEIGSLSLMRISPFPTHGALDALHHFFPPDKTILSINSGRCIWEKCLSGAPWNRDFECTTPFANRETFLPVTKITYEKMHLMFPAIQCALFILPIDNIFQINWVKEHGTNYIAILVNQEWSQSRCEDVIKCLLQHYRCVDIHYFYEDETQGANFCETQLWGHEVIFLIRKDVSDARYTTEIDHIQHRRSDANTYQELGIKSPLWEFDMLLRTHILRRFLLERTSMRPLALPSELTNLDDFPLLFADVAISIDMRYVLAEHLSWMLLTQKQVSAIVEFLEGTQEVLSIGCGFAFWESIIERYSNCHFVCTDIEEQPSAFHDVEVISSTNAHLKYSHLRVVFIGFPNRTNHSAEFTQMHKPENIVLVGNEQGLTGTDQLFEYLALWYDVERTFCDVTYDDHLHFSSIVTDVRSEQCLYLCTRRNKTK